jgi:hypothetical protein
LIAGLIRRDLPFYSASISAESVSGMTRFARACGLLTSDPGYDRIVASRFRALWDSASL